MHVFPQLRKLEEKYSSELAVVGVHSAKFDAEKATQNVRQAILRYEIEHPVVNDAGFEVWRQYAVRAWPTLMFVDPAGKVIGKHEGEIQLRHVRPADRRDDRRVRRRGSDRPAPHTLRHRAGEGVCTAPLVPRQGAGGRRTATGSSSPTRTTTGSWSPPWAAA